MDQKAKMILGLVGTGVAGVLVGGLFVYLLVKPAGEEVPAMGAVGKGSAPVKEPVVASGKATGTSPSGAGIVDDRKGGSVAEDRLCTPPDIRNKVILSEDPEGIRQKLVPSRAPKMEPDNEPNEFGALPKQEIWEKIKTQRVALDEIGKGRVEYLRKIAELKGKNDKENPEILALQKEFNEKKRLLETKMDALPGIAEHQARWNDLKKESDALARRRETATLEIKNLTGAGNKPGESRTTESAGKPVEALTRQVEEINKKIDQNEESMLKEMLGMNSIKLDARENDPEIKALTAEAIEKEHLLEAKRNQVPDVLEARKKLQELDKQYEQAAKLNSKLHKALMVPVSATSGS